MSPSWQVPPQDSACIFCRFRICSPLVPHWCVQGPQLVQLPIWQFTALQGGGLGGDLRRLRLRLQKPKFVSAIKRRREIAIKTRLMLQFFWNLFQLGVVYFNLSTTVLFLRTWQLSRTFTDLYTRQSKKTSSLSIFVRVVVCKVKKMKERQCSDITLYLILIKTPVRVLCNIIIIFLLSTSSGFSFLEPLILSWVK